MKSKYGPAATLNQIEEQIERLTDAEWMKLRKMAQANLWGLRLDNPDEIINETLERLIKGDRVWYVGMAFIPWMRSAMKSVANGMRSRNSVKNEIPVTELAGDSASDIATEIFGSDDKSPLDIVLTEEARCLAEADLAKITAYFKGNKNVEAILLGIEDGLSPEQLREYANISITEYESARRYLRRGLDKLFPVRRQK